ncbi:uncharacterized protein METZ01_LOCUS446942 [marine metagenome]|uniref:Uncharacterized protein n=1 Tax=marine metagenome TaxID=408172 RepID=A0A382ZHB3_9ZZZZ
MKPATKPTVTSSPLQPIIWRITLGFIYLNPLTKLPSRLIL